jgi:peptidoglycan/xylan/chitin deacetylase (PgdA/CDA1 family)
MLKNNIVPIVIHEVVESVCVDFGDITIASLKKIFSQNPNSYITIQDLNDKSIDRNVFLYMVTFDDGHLSNYTIVFPLLESLGVKATFFINTGSIGKPGFLDWNMVVEMQKKGNVFGSHGHNHLKMTDISLQESKYEFIKSKELYELNTGMEISLFSFPHGLYNNRLLELSIECGYSNCFISKHGVIHLIGGVIPRNSINSSMDNSDISKILNPSIVVLSKWFLEDKIKYIVKNIIGEHFYKILRRMVLKSTI